MNQTTSTPLPPYQPPDGNLEDGTQNLELLAHAREATPTPDQDHDPQTSTSISTDPETLEAPPPPTCPTPTGALKYPPNGGPATKWSPEVERNLIEGLRAGKTLIAICRQSGMPAAGTVAWWEHQSQSFRNRLDTARATGAEALVQACEDELQALGKDGQVYGMQEVSKARDLGGHWRWRAERADPARFGRHLTISGRIDHVHTSVREAAPEWLEALVDVTPSRPALEAPAAPSGEPDEDDPDHKSGPFNH